MFLFFSSSFSAFYFSLPARLCHQSLRLLAGPPPPRHVAVAAAGQLSSSSSPANCRGRFNPSGPLPRTSSLRPPDCRSEMATHARGGCQCQTPLGVAGHASGATTLVAAGDLRAGRPVRRTGGPPVRATPGRHAARASSLARGKTRGFSPAGAARSQCRLEACAAARRWASGWETPPPVRRLAGSTSARRPPPPPRSPPHLTYRPRGNHDHPTRGRALAPGRPVARPLDQHPRPHP